MHLTGAMMVFGCGTVFAFLDALISYKMYPVYNGLTICRVRMLVATLSCITLVTSILMRYIYINSSIVCLFLTLTLHLQCT